MLEKPVRSKQDRRPAALAVVLIAAVMVMSCASIGNVSSAVGAASTAAAAVSSQAGGAATPAATSAAAVPQSTARCQTIGAAYVDFQTETPWLAALATDGAYSANTPDSPTYINIPKVQADLDVMGTLPNGSLGPISPAIAQIRQLVDQVSANFKSGGKPFSDGSGNGQKVLDLYLKIALPLTVIADAFASACPHFTPSTALPDVAGFQIGQTASVGDLRVTLDKVSEAGVGAGSLPQPGNRFLLLHVTIKNVGQTALQVSAMSETNLKDATGNSYGFDPAASAAVAASGDNSIDATIPPGGTQAGLVAYQLPANAGDLLWFFHDFGAGRAIFAVKANDIDTSAASSGPTQDALRASAGATQTAFFNMVATAEAAQPTDTPAP